MTTFSPVPTKHAGVLIPLDMFRISHLAGVTAELLVSKARNIIDAKLVLTRHAQSQIVLGRIEGQTVGDDPLEFWRENADVVLAMSQVLPRQCFMYYAQTAPAAERREGFLVAQRGQVLAANDASADRQAPGSDNWPVTKLCEQLRVTMDELALGFEGGPRVEVRLVEPNVDDQAMLMTLAGQTAPDQAGDEADPAAATETGAASQGQDKPARISVQDDLKRREKERVAEQVERERRAEQLRSDLPYHVDELGVLVALSAELSEPALLAPFILPNIEGDLPTGLPRELADQLQGKRCDIAVKVSFLSEVFVDNKPLTRPLLQERATTLTLDGRELMVMEVLAPRLGYGSLLSTGKAPHVFVSRKPELELPAKLVVELLGG